MGKKRVAVIGSGFGGLSAAIRLQAQGFAVTVFEKRDKPGGRAYVYRDQGFTFDAGPTVITAPECIEELFELCGKRMTDYVEMLPVSPFYRLYWEDGYRFDYSRDLEATVAQIQKKSPGDAKGYLAFLDYSKRVFDEGYTKLAHVPFLDIWSMVKVSPQLMRLEAFRTVYAMVSRHIKDPQLRQAFSFHSLLVGGNPFSTSSIYTLIHYLERKWGVFFPRGGTSSLVEGMVKLFTDCGGEMRLSTPVDSIWTEKGEVKGVEFQDRREPFDCVVSNADVTYSYQQLLRKEKAVEHTRKWLQSASYSMSLFLIYFGTRKRYPSMAHHNVLFGARYRELLEDIFTHGTLADDFSLYLHAPTVTDPSMAPPGCEAFYVLSPVPHLGKADIDWESEGPRYRDRILNYLDQNYLPGLKENLVTSRIFTPKDFKEELNTHLGSAFSLEPLLRQSAYFRVGNRDPEIRGLYFVGAGTHPGAGVPGVIGSAKATAGLVIADYGAISKAQEFLTSESQSVTSESQSEAGASPQAVSEALSQCRSMIRVGSKSFSMAARLFRPETRDAAFFLYGWCRHCDDEIDGTDDRALQALRLQSLEAATRDIFQGTRSDSPVFLALGYLAKRYRIPHRYPFELLAGLRMDLEKQTYETLEDLSIYCYRVASTVGLMMVHVMGISDEQALQHAADLGKAMQLTNIARDVLDDARMGRVYLPLQWLREEGIREPSAEAVLDPNNRGAVTRVVGRVLREADRNYASGEKGLRFLPFRASLAVAVAGQVYSEIGRKVERRGTAAWDSRTVVSRWGKCLAVFRGAALTLATLPFRLYPRWRAKNITLIWTPQ